jgi:hypothetical protein
LTGEERDRMADRSAKWDDFRKRRKFAWLVFGFTVPSFVIAILLPRTMRFHDPLVGALMAAWFVAWMFAMVRLLLVRCPRCGEYFSQGRLLNTGFWAGKCVHCGLPKYSRD